MKNKRKILEIVEQTVKDSFQGGKLSASKVNRYINLFKQLPKSVAITYLTAYKRGLKREEEKTILNIQSSVPLSSAHKQIILNLFKKENRISKVEVQTNPSLLGGVLIKIGDMIYEDTITSRINQLGEIIANG